MADKRIWTVDEIKGKLEKSDEMVKRSLLKMYEYQTSSEQAHGATTDENGVGFNGCDSEFLSSIAEQVKAGKPITIKQLPHVRKKLLKYAKQITKIANGELQQPEDRKPVKHTRDTNDRSRYDRDFIRYEEAEHRRAYSPSSTAGDYSPSNPWDAPGMSMKDFI